MVLRITMVWSSVEYQVSETISRERSLPACPAANVRVMRVPSVCSPSMIWVPRDSLFMSVGFAWEALSTVALVSTGEGTVILRAARERASKT